MNKKLVLDLKHHAVYYIESDSVNYYVTVPKDADTTNISIELKSRMSNYDITTNDEIWVMENIKTTFSYIDNYNITLVLPILKEEEISILEKLDTTKFDSIDRIMGTVINGSYLLLKENNKKILNQVIMVNNDRFKTFITWFTTKYQGRVICKKLLDLIQLYNVNATSYKKLETPLINFVVGSYNTEVDAPKIVAKEPEPEVVSPINNKLQPQMSSGFASYFWLAILTVFLAGIVILIVVIYK